MAGEKKLSFSKEFKRNYDATWKGSGPSALFFFHKVQTHNPTNKTMAPVSDTGKKTPSEDDVN